MVTLQEFHAAHLRHAHHYLEQLRVANEHYRSGGERVWESLSQFQRDWDQIERGQHWTTQHLGDVKAAGLCSDYPLAGSDLLVVHHATSDRIAWLEAALTAAAKFDLPRSQCAHLGALGHACWDAGHVEQAKDYLARALELAAHIDDRVNLAQAHYYLGDIAQKQGDFAAATHHTQICLDLNSTSGDANGVASALLQLAGIRLDEGDFDDVERLAQESLDQFRAMADHAGTARALARLGTLAGRRREFAQAEQYFGESYALYRKLGDPEGQGLTLKMLGVTATVQGDYIQARQWYAASLALFQRLGHQYGVGLAYMNLGENDQYTGDTAQAQQHYQQALAIFRALETPDELANTLFRMANADEDRSQRAQAGQWLAEARDIYQELGNHSMLAASLSLLGLFAVESGALADAEAYLNEGLAAAEAAADPWVTASVRFNWSKLDYQRGNLTQARQHWCQAFDCVVGFRSPGMILEGMQYLLDILVASEQFELAYELAVVVGEHPATLETVRQVARALAAKIEAHLPEDGRQAAQSHAAARDLDTYCTMLLDDCAAQQ